MTILLLVAGVTMEESEKEVSLPGAGSEETADTTAAEGEVKAEGEAEEAKAEETAE